MTFRLDIPEAILAALTPTERAALVAVELRCRDHAAANQPKPPEPLVRKIIPGKALADRASRQYGPDGRFSYEPTPER